MFFLGEGGGKCRCWNPQHELIIKLWLLRQYYSWTIIVSVGNFFLQRIFSPVIHPSLKWGHKTVSSCAQLRNQTMSVPSDNFHTALAESILYISFLVSLCLSQTIKWGLTSNGSISANNRVSHKQLEER